MLLPVANHARRSARVGKARARFCDDIACPSLRYTKRSVRSDSPYTTMNNSLSICISISSSDCYHTSTMMLLRVPYREMSCSGRHLLRPALCLALFEVFDSECREVQHDRVCIVIFILDLLPCDHQADEPSSQQLNFVCCCLKI